MYILLFGLLAVASGTPTCSLDQCPESITNFKFFPINEEELVHSCLKGLNVLDCLVGVIKRCPENVDKVSKVVILEFEKILDGLCSQTEFRSRYLRNAACIKEHHTETILLCSKKASEDKDFCQNMEDISKCMTNNIVEKCGKEAGEVFDEMIVPSKKTVSVHCS